jgi:hypothetical protein
MQCEGTVCEEACAILDKFWLKGSKLQEITDEEGWVCCETLITKCKSLSAKTEELLAAKVAANPAAAAAASTSLSEVFYDLVRSRRGKGKLEAQETAKKVRHGQFVVHREHVLRDIALMMDAEPPGFSATAAQLAQRLKQFKASPTSDSYDLRLWAALGAALKAGGGMFVQEPPPAGETAPPPESLWKLSEKGHTITIPVRVVTWNVLSTGMGERKNESSRAINGVYEAGVYPSFYNSAHRLLLLKEKLREQMRENSIICLQELSLEWMGELHSFFARGLGDEEHPGQEPSFPYILMCAPYVHLDSLEHQVDCVGIAFPSKLYRLDKALVQRCKELLPARKGGHSTVGAQEAGAATSAPSSQGGGPGGPPPSAGGGGTAGGGSAGGETAGGGSLWGAGEAGGAGSLPAKKRDSGPTFGEEAWREARRQARRRENMLVHVRLHTQKPPYRVFNVST